MEINYTVKVLEVGTNSLTVEFASPGVSTKVVGTPLVPANIVPKDFFRQYAPLVEWEQELIPRQTLVAGQEIADTISVSGTQVTSSIPQETITVGKRDVL